MLRKKSLLFCCIFVAIFSTGFIPSEKNMGRNVMLNFENYVGNDLMHLDSSLYKNEMGQSFNVSKFRYYISNVQLKGMNEKEYSSNEYFLVDEYKSRSGKISLENVPDGEYGSMSFILGVDSLHNCDGIQSGALDPINGMFWAWNTGYVFMKLEGTSPDSKSMGNKLEFHIGGYKAPANCIRSITLNFEKPLKVSDGKIPSVNIKVDASEIFRTPSSIDFSKLSSVTDFNNATMIADNYSDMFSILNIE